MSDGPPATPPEESSAHTTIGRPGRGGCLAFVALWLCVAGASLAVGLLAVKGELVLRRGELNEARVWLVAEPQRRGLGISSTRFVEGNRNADSACLETRVRFIMWRGAAEPALSYCECYGRVAGGGLEYTGMCGE